MTRIKTVRVLGVNYTLVGDTKLGTESCTSGKFIPDLCKIALNPALKAQEQGTTIIHEILEAVAFKLQLRGKEYGHDQLHAQAETLYSVLRDNPALIRAVLGGKSLV